MSVWSYIFLTLLACSVVAALWLTVDYRRGRHRAPRARGSAAVRIRCDITPFQAAMVRAREATAALAQAVRGRDQSGNAAVGLLLAVAFGLAFYTVTIVALVAAVRSLR